MQRLTRSSTVAAMGVGVGFAAYASFSYLPNAERLDDGSPRRTFTGQIGFQSLTLESVEQVNHNVKRLRFALPQKDAVSGLTLNSALLTYSYPSGSWLPALRPYSPISDVSDPGHVDLLIKRYPNGKQSNYIHSLAPGQTLSFRGPLVHYNWTLNAYSHIALIAGGAGITPCFQLISGILKNPEEKTRITLVFGNQTDEDVLLKNEFDELKKSHPRRLQVVYTVSKGEEKAGYRKGYITRELLKDVLPRNDTEERMKVFVCGPPGLEESVAGKKGFLGFGATGGILAELGYDKGMVHRF